jgi:serine/threonine protein kinase
MPGFGQNFFVKRQRLVSFLLSPRPLLSFDENRRFLYSSGSIEKRDGIMPRPYSSSRLQYNGSILGAFSVNKGDPAHLAELQHKYPKVPDLIFQQRLGSGASGEVLLVNDMTNGSNVALKRIVVDLSHLNRGPDQDPLGEVLAEVECLKVLSDKRVVGYKGCFFDGDGPQTRFCILMEYCPGQSLWHKIELVRRDAIAREKILPPQKKNAAEFTSVTKAALQPWLGLTPQFIVKVFRQMAEGLNFLHLQGVIHAGQPDGFDFFSCFLALFTLFIVALSMCF